MKSPAEALAAVSGNACSITATFLCYHRSEQVYQEEKGEKYAMYMCIHGIYKRKYHTQ